MAKGYKRDSRGRFNGGYGAGALGGKGAYVSRPNSGKGSRGGGTAKLANPKGVKARSKRVGVAFARGAKRAGKQYAKNLGTGALLLGGAVAANAAMNAAEKRLTRPGSGGKPLGSYSNVGVGRREVLGTGGKTSVKDAAFNAANPMFAKYSAPGAFKTPAGKSLPKNGSILTGSVNKRRSTYSPSSRAARPGR